MQLLWSRSALFHLNHPGLQLWGLRDAQPQHAVLHRGLDVGLIEPRAELDGPMKIGDVILVPIQHHAFVPRNADLAADRQFPALQRYVHVSFLHGGHVNPDNIRLRTLYDVDAWCQGRRRFHSFRRPCFASCHYRLS